jgi:hypothetical protein
MKGSDVKYIFYLICPITIIYASLALIWIFLYNKLGEVHCYAVENLDIPLFYNPNNISQ